jgi:GAF domain-containing protein/HAMP domain-containing protein
VIGKLTHLVTSSIRGKILSSFVIVLALVVAVAIAGYYQLGQVKSASERITPTTAQLEFLQDYARAVSSLGADVESYITVGGTQVIHDRITQDLGSMKGALGSVIENADEEMDPFFLTQLERETANLESEVLDLLEVAPADLRSGKTSERVALIYSRIDAIERLHQQLSIEVLGRLRATALQQKTIASNVSAQFLILAVATFAIVVVTTLLVTRSIAAPVAGLAGAAARIAEGDLEARAPVITRDEIGQLATAFNRMATQLHEVISSLERRVAERTRDLEHRTHYLEVSAQVARDATSMLEPHQLLERVVRLVSERFGFYHVGIFLLDEDREWAVLQAVSSEGGQRMLERGHRLRIGEEGIVGYVAGYDRPRVALDVDQDAVFFDTPELPETHSEIALPLRSRGEIIGVLDVQSREEAAFSGEDIGVLQTLADLIAVAIVNARLFQQAQETLEAEQRAYGQLSREGWRNIFLTRPELGHCYDPQGLLSGGEWREEMKLAARKGETVLDEPSGTAVVPIKVRDQVIGVLDAHKPAGGEEWTQEQIGLLETLAEQLGVALESARLYQDTQRRAVRERLTTEVTGRMRETLDMETVLKVAAQELRRSLGLPEVVIRLTTGPGES